MNKNKNKKLKMSHYVEYYDAQVGNGDIKQVCAGSLFQRGHGGIGRFLGGLFPFLKRGAWAVGKEALRDGMNIIHDFSSHQVPFKESLRSRVHKSGNNLKYKAEKIERLMKRSGYKRQVR